MSGQNSPRSWEELRNASHTRSEGRCQGGSPCHATKWITANSDIRASGRRSRQFLANSYSIRSKTSELIQCCHHPQERAEPLGALATFDSLPYRCALPESKR
jgi:hypothetical protein